MMYAIRFLLTFALLCAVVGFLTLLGATPSWWTVALIVVASAATAYMTKPEDV